MNIYIQKNDPHTTLTTWLYCSFQMMWAAEQLGHKAYINWPNGYGSLIPYRDNAMFAKSPNQYQWYFMQPHKELDGYAPQRDATWIWEGWADPMPVNFMAQPLQVIKDYYKKNLIFNQTTNERGQTLVKKYHIDFSKTIGLTWRGTDNVTDGRPRLPIETYFPWIDDILKDHPDYRIMATAEEKEILTPLLKHYQNAFTIDEFVSSPLGSAHNPERLGTMSGYEKGLQPALMVWLFSKCAHYIKNRSSTGAIASWLSNGRIVCLGHEETLSYNLAHDYVEIEGKKYPYK